MFTMLVSIAYYKRYGIKNHIVDVVEFVKYYYVKKSINTQKYDCDVTPRNRYLSIGFDDFRDSDFDLIIPLFKKYNASATFNRIAFTDEFSKKDLWQINQVFKNGNELGDHTFFHCNYIYTDALFNGQNPYFPEGEQNPFPSNEQLRSDYGDGKNAFGFDLTSSVQEVCYGYPSYSNKKLFDTTWKNLTDEECQFIRDSFSIYKDTTGKLEILDRLSNKYLGTTGCSFGSFDSKKGIYTGGIFSGAKTSANHEIWERVLEITKSFYKENYNENFDFVTWSWPGDPYSPFKFINNEKFYYDEKCTKLYNYLARFDSSILNVSRSFVDVLLGGVLYNA